MGEIIILDAFRAEIAHQQRAAVIAGHDGLKIGQSVRIKDTSRDHVIYGFTNSGCPLVLVEGRSRALQAHEFEV